MAMKIYFNSKTPEYEWLSNMYPAPFKNEAGIKFVSSEHYYMWCKADNKDDANRVLNVGNSWAAKKIGNTVKLRADWHTYRLVAMKKALRLKFTQNQELKDKLLATGDVELIEYAPWGDIYWGVDKSKKGQNNLGKLLMELREELKNE